MRLILSLLFILTTLLISSQSIKKADFLHSKGYHEEAIQIYTDKLAKVKKDKIKYHIYKQLTYCYNELHNEEKAYKYFNKIDPKLRSKKDSYTGFQLLRSLRKYDEADELLKNSDSLKSDKVLLDISQWSIEKINETNGSYQLYNTNLETNGHSFGYALDKNGFLLFSSLIHELKGGTEAHTYFYDLYKYPKINDSTFDLKKGDKVIKDDRRIFYRGTPNLNKNEGKVYFTTNSSESFKYTKMNAEKKEVSNEGENILKIFEYDVENNSFESLPINSNSYHNCFPHIYSDSVLFFSSSKEAESSMLDIYYIIKRNNEWTKPTPLLNVNTFEDEVYPFVFDNKFYFSSRGREGFGGMDIYMGELNYNNKGYFEVLNIKNLLQPLNSSKDDFAYYQNTKSGGYISSNRKDKNGEDAVYFFSKSLGDSINGVVIDAVTKKEIPNVIYKIYEKNNEKWELINTEDLNDPALFSSIIDPDKNYKISFEREGYYSEEVQIPNSSFEELRNEIKEFIKVIELEPKSDSPIVYDIITNQPIEGAEVVITNKEGEVVSRVYTDRDGKWSADFDYNNVDINVLKSNYEKLAIDFSEWDNPNSGMYKKSAMTPSHKIGDKMTINNIYFEFDSSKIRPESFKILDNIVKFMNRYPEVEFELGAHTDCVGPDSYNENLSDRRAQSCWKYLISAGIDKNRMKPKGYGERVPVHPCAEQRADDAKALLNRRIEMTILK